VHPYAPPPEAENIIRTGSPPPEFEGIPSYGDGGEVRLGVGHGLGTISATTPRERCGDAEVCRKNGGLDGT